MYTAENTQGYTETQLAEFNRELDAWLLFASINKGDDLTEDECHEIIKRHERHVAAQ